MLRKLFTRPIQEQQRIIIVSGLPRSGTSMVMKMLSAGGLEIVTDSLREPDEDNPNGYFELEMVKQLKDGDHGWLANSRGKAVKVISYLLEYLPSNFGYDIIFVERDIQEVLASQKKMLERRKESSNTSDETMEEQFQQHLKAVKYWLPRQENMRSLFVSYNTILKTPEPICEAIKAFLDVPLDTHAMLSVPDRSLYRNRSES